MDEGWSTRALGFEFLKDRGKDFWIFERKLCQDFPVEGNTFLFRGVDEAAIAHAFLPRCGINTNIPEIAKFTFFLSAIAISVRPGLKRGDACKLNLAFAAPHVSFCEPQKIFSSLQVSFAAFHSSHKVLRPHRNRIPNRCEYYEYRSLRFVLFGLIRYSVPVGLIF